MYISCKLVTDEFTFFSKNAPCHINSLHDISNFCEMCAVVYLF